MNLIRSKTLLTAACLSFALPCGCKKDKKDGTSETTTPDATTGAAADTDASQEEAMPVFDVVQEPDPAEIGAARTSYLLGDYPAVIESLTPLREDLASRDQYRASGLAAGWLALALARDVVENAQPHAKYAVEMAVKTRDPEVIAVANMAAGVVELGFEDYPAAVASLDKAAGAKAPPTESALAHAFLGEALIGRAYGAGGGAKLQNPEDLDRARDAYERGLGPAASADPADAVIGKLQEGLAAIGKYQGKYDKLCEHALIAEEKYESAGASDYLKEGPAILIRDGRCAKE